MDPFLEKNPIFHELHTQMLAEAQAYLQPQLRPKYIAKLERHLSEGSVWDLEGGAISLERKEPDLTLAEGSLEHVLRAPTVVLASPTAQTTEDLEPDELEMRKQRRIVIYIQARPRLAVTSIELLSPSNKEPKSIGQARYLEKRASALHGGLHWVEIDLLRGGERPPMNVALANAFDYLIYVAKANPTGWNHLVYSWKLQETLPRIPIPLLGEDQATFDLEVCFREAYDRIAADDEADYAGDPPGPPLRDEDRSWADALLRKSGFR